MAWRKQWGYEVQRTRYPGVYRTRPTGHLVTARVTDPKTGKRTWRIRVLPDADLETAKSVREALSSGLRDAVQGATRRRALWSSYAASLFQAKVTAGEIQSAKGREKWASILEKHLVPAFGERYCDELRYADIEAWRMRELAPLVSKGELSPRTANTWLSVLKVICKKMSAEYEMRDPAVAVAFFDTSTKPTYTDERPNAIPPSKVAEFLRRTKAAYPRLYPMVYLGFATGLRPSSLRPLRRKGDSPDVLWDEGVLLVRRSNSLGQEVMQTTKTKKHQRLPLPSDVVDVLRKHVASFGPGTVREKSDLLFPGRRGTIYSRSALDPVFRQIGGAMGLSVTPRSMRRTFKDVARAAGVSDFVRKSVSGHTTGAMDEHYSTAQASELRDGMAAIAATLVGRKKAVGKAVRR